VASGGSIGMIMPPSVVLIIYGILTQQSIGALFVAGIFPALLITLLFILCIYIRCTISPKQGPPGESFTWAEKLKALLGLGETLAVFALVIGINVYVVYGVAQTVFRQAIPLQTIFKGVIPFLAALIVGVIILILFPQIILFLPNLLY
jgi:TRAP-type C4-dicarboxylate transport system permease large subunit